MHDSESAIPDFADQEFNVEPVPRLVVDAVPSFNYAAWQNAVPLLQSVAINNAGGDSLAKLTVELKASPGFVRPKRWQIDRVGADEIFLLRDLDVEIDPAYLEGLDEAERGVLTFRLVQNGEVLHQVEHSLRVLARDEWGGVSTMAELLPAFVTPNDPALAPLLRAAATLLGQNGHATGLDGYQSGDPNRAFLLAASLWSAVAGRKLIYANPPSSFEEVGQKVRRVGQVLGDALATCLDTSLLFASALEFMGLNPVLVMTQGHCFVGVWLVEKTFKQLVETDCSEPRKAIVAKELIVFETTLVTSQPAAHFDHAVSAATHALAEEREHEFVAVIDVRRARMAQILPLASHSARSEDTVESEDSGPLPLPAAPGYELTPTSEVVEQPTTPAGRIDRWQRKLLDLSLRNRLLNFRPTRQTVPVLCPDVSRLEDLLADGKRMRLISLADSNPVAQRDAKLVEKRTKKQLDLEFASQALDRHEVACPVDSRDLDLRLTALFRKVRSDLAEGGSNTLYLAVGFLRWKQRPTDDSTYRAPLLLVPVKLMRRSASSPIYLANHEDDVRFNATLLQLLKKDFDCYLPEFEGDLPTDDSGVDVPLVLDRMRQAVRDIPGFEVVEEAAIAPFSFAKYLMWKDLVDRVGQLEQNRVVRHLIHDPDKPFVVEGAGPMPQPHEIDTRYSPEQIVHPLPADSSQLAAVMAAAEGHDLVIVGPPGTGKSQTIANVIAQCLAVSKTVLFVAEKTAALDVVYRRLREHGLGDCCIELHSNKAERRRFLDQLEASWEKRRAENTQQWVEINDQLRVRRDQLNAYAAALHAPAANRWTAYRAMGVCVRGREAFAPSLPWPDSVRHDREAYDHLKSTIAELATTFAAVKVDSALIRVQALEWSMAWERNLLESCQTLLAASQSLSHSLNSFSQTLGIPLADDLSSAGLSQVYRLAQELTAETLPPEGILLHGDLQRLRTALGERQELLQRSSQSLQALEAAMARLVEACGAKPSSAIPDAMKGPLLQLAQVLVGMELPPAELVYHSHFDSLAPTLAARVGLLEARGKAFLALEARSFNPVLIERIQVTSIQKQWSEASSAFWPLSIWKKSAVKKKLKAYMRSDGVVEPEIDLALLEEFREACSKLQQNLEALSLSPSVAATVENQAEALAAPLQSAATLREAISQAGLAPILAGNTKPSSLEPLAAVARLLLSLSDEVDTLRSQLQENLAKLGLPPELQSLVTDNAEALNSEIQAAGNIRQQLNTLATSGEALQQALSTMLSVSAPLRREAAGGCRKAAKSFQNAWASYTQHASVPPVANDSLTVVADAATQANGVLTHRTSLKQWIAWNSVRKRAEQQGLWSFVEALQAGDITAEEAVSRFELAYARWWLPAVVDRREPLRTFQKFLHEDAIEDFRRLDELAREAAAPHARRAVYHDLPPSEQVPRKSELGLLRHQMRLKRPSKSIREVISNMPETFGKLAPCLLMSPLSIAQYLPTEQAVFDVVIFDEASQIATWDAIGAIARGRQTIIVGDPKQLPPTNFFGRTDNDDDEELDDHEKDLESILDEAQASGLPTLQLNWHYRSRHESLIAFSNWNYYGNNLVTFPAAESADRGVSLKIIQGALYDRGKSRTNRQEAEAIVADAVARMKLCLAKPEEQRLTYGVVTFNSQQQELIQDLFDEAQRNDPELEWFFADDRIEPTAVKNLENVQGDERDVMMFSITFGFDAAGKFPVDFGAINREGGERRLNVAITRARQELIVFASFLPEQLRAERSGARGIHDLKAFLEYADKGPEAIVARVEGSLGGFDSPLEESVAAELQQRGWQVETQIGVSGFRIDLGVVHPDLPGSYLAGVECDGATYHRSAVARDRDKTRQFVLENLGWSIVRIWSTDWWYDPATAIEQLHGRLTDLLEKSRRETSPENAQTDSEYSLEKPDLGDEEDFDDESLFDDLPLDLPDRFRPNSADSQGERLAKRQPLIARQAQPTSRHFYPRVELGDASADQDRFFADDYSASLREMALAVLEAQAPIRDDALAREIARAHGFARTGNRIKQRLMDLLPEVTTTKEEVGTFLWHGPSAPEVVPFRYAANDSDRRSLDEICMPELLGLIREHAALAEVDDPALALARELGLARLARSARERLEQALEASGEL